MWYMPCEWRGTQPMSNDLRTNLLVSFLKNGSIFQDVLNDYGWEN